MKRLLSLPRGRTLDCGEVPLVMGIVNLTPDSFFAGSRRLDPLEAADRAQTLEGEGAAILDFGAESTRPGSRELDPAEEISRLIPALREFRKRNTKAIVSVDTRHEAAARAALDEGADLINDIAALSDPAMAATAARYGAAVILMHMKGEPGTMQEKPEYDDCAAEVRDFLKERVSRALEAGIPASALVLDPGIGFGKTYAHNLDLLERLYLLAECGYPVLVGLSRKRMIGELTGRSVEERMAGSLGAACAAWTLGADILRVHDVAATVDALNVYSALAGIRHLDRRGRSRWT